MDLIELYFSTTINSCIIENLLTSLYYLSGAKKDWCFMCEFEILILKAKEGKSPLSPIGILSQLRNIGSQLGNGREEDAHEFLRCASSLYIWSL